LIEWNSRINLVARKNIEENLGRIVTECFYPAVCDEKVLAGSALDVGSGGGFPGLILKIWKPEVLWTLVESVRKKTLFLKRVAGELELSGVTVVNDRAENLPAEMAGQYDLVATRGMGPLSETYPHALRHLKPGGSYVCFKTAGVEDELASLSGHIGENKILPYEVFREEGFRGTLLVFRNPK
jgi:16S rRNA (guanine527-N7)-methyltransferase